MKDLKPGLKLLIGSMVLALATACATSPKEEAVAPAAPEAVPETAPAPVPEPVPVPVAPVAEPAPAPVPAPKAEVITSYTVVAGDNLWTIAGLHTIYGNPYQWPLIYKANSKQIKDADLIHPDQVLVIPRDASASEIEAAIEHAKTRGAWSLGLVEDTDVAYLRVNGVVAQR